MSTDELRGSSNSSSTNSRRKRKSRSESRFLAWCFQMMFKANLSGTTTAREKGKLLIDHISTRKGQHRPQSVTCVVIFCDESLISGPPDSDSIVSIELRPCKLRWMLVRGGEARQVDCSDYNDLISVSGC